MTKPLLGVNLGGWLVSERWMTPWLYEGTQATSEYELMQTPGGRARIRRHHAEYMSEDDFKWLQRVGVQLLRLPVGYWVLHGDRHYQSAAGRLDWAFRMAEKYNMQILLSFHGAPGSQNGRDHSGRAGEVQWYQRVNRVGSRHTLTDIAARYRDSPALWGVQLLNEPKAQTTREKWQLWAWSWRTMHRVRRVVPPTVRMVVSDCYDLAFWRYKLKNATLDIHHYQCFSEASRDMTLTEQCEVAALSQRTYEQIARRRPVIIGEWSATLPGRTASNIAQWRQYVAAQQQAFSSVDAIIFWSYRSAEADGWNFRHLMENQGFQAVKKSV